jgi:8-oxo-dGTP diphosphatase
MIVAAGCVVTRPAGDEPEVLLVHRPRYDDWSLPKGKLDAGEHETTAAVREVLEETGYRVALRRPLPRRRYEVGGEPKVVHYWRAVIMDEESFTPGDEVDEIRWLPVSEAASLITQADDATIVKLATEPAGTPFIVLRHGHAVKRADWSGDDVDRPLTVAGVEQADALVERLTAFGVQRVHSSAARRCADTVRPFSLAAGVPLASEPALTEESFRAAPSDALQRVSGLLADTWRTGEPAVLCGHRPYLPVLVDHLVALSPVASGADPWDHPLPDTVPTASLTVLHLHQDERTGLPQTLALEHHPR